MNNIWWQLYRIAILISWLNAIFYTFCYALSGSGGYGLLAFLWIGWMAFIGLQECWVMKGLGRA